MSLLRINSKPTIAMRKIIKSQIKTLSVAAVAVLSFTSAAHAAINLDFVYDPATQNTTATYEGNWDITYGTNVNYGNSETFTSDLLRVTIHGGSGYYHGESAVTLPWTTASINSHTGADFGFSSIGQIYGPLGFDSTTDILGTMTFVAQDLGDLGFNSAEIAYGGVITTPGGAVNWTATAVPEPSTYAGIVGIVALAAVAIRRRRS
jgi:hypothetical protein